jgi:hypothetical protein
MTTGLALVPAFNFSTDSVLSVKTSSSHKSKSCSGTSSSSTSSFSKELKNLVACETTSAKGTGGISQNQVLNCYSNAFPRNTTATTNSTASNLTIGGISGGSSSSTHHGPSSSRSHLHSSSGSSTSTGAS